MQPRSSRKVSGMGGFLPQSFGFLPLMLTTLMNAVIEINSDDSDDDKEQAGGGYVYHKGTDCELRGSIPAYPAIETVPFPLMTVR